MVDGCVGMGAVGDGKLELGDRWELIGVIGTWKEQWDAAAS